MKKFRRIIPLPLLILLFSILFLLEAISCYPLFVRKSTPTPAPKDAWLVEWLENPICQPPCFLGITPGMTSISDTIQLLSQMPAVEITREPLTPLIGIRKELSWKFLTTITNGGGGRIISDESGKITLIIDLGIGKDQYLELSGVISTFGPPDYVYLPYCRDRICEIHLIYMTSGMVLQPLLPAKVGKNNKHSVDISPDVRVYEIWFFPPGEDGYREAFGYWADYLSGSQLSWNGYTKYTEK